MNNFFHVYAIKWLWVHGGHFFGMIYHAFTLHLRKGKLFHEIIVKLFLIIPFRGKSGVKWAIHIPSTCLEVCKQPISQEVLIIHNASNFGSHQILKSYGISIMVFPKSSTWKKYLQGSIKEWEWIEMVETSKDNLPWVWGEFGIFSHSFRP